METIDIDTALPSHANPQTGDVRDNFTGTKTALETILLSTFQVYSVNWSSLPSIGDLISKNQLFKIADFTDTGLYFGSDGSKYVCRAVDAYRLYPSSPFSTNSTAFVKSKEITYPIGMLYAGSSYSFTANVSKSSTAEIQSWEARLGTTGTSADTLLQSGTAAATVSGFQITTQFAIVDNTHVAIVNDANRLTANNKVTISDISANNLKWTLWQKTATGAVTMTNFMELATQSTFSGYELSPSFP